MHCANQDMRINAAEAVEKDGTAQKNARHCIGKKEVTNENADDCFRLLHTKLGMTVW